ncbi:MAG: radical SAM protein [Candidatus Latescibacter sp.]|nr:radical SAM protein [Candidatus Latescibacter sp.]
MRPFICNYYLTYRCNARCSFCGIWKTNDVPISDEASPDVVCRNLGDIRRLGVRIVDFTGGEPLLYQGIGRVLRYARRLGFLTTLTTNGIRYTECAAEIADCISVLQFSLDAAESGGHDAVKGVPSFDRVMEAIDLARLLGENPTFIHTVTDDNLSRVPDVIALARRMRVPLFLNPCFPYFGNRGLSPESARQLGSMARGPGISIDRGFLAFLIDGGNSRENPDCLAVTSTLVISSDDCLILPCFHRGITKIPIRGRLFALRNSPLIREEMAKEGRYPFCEGCAVNCYIRASLFRKPGRYFIPTIISAAKYIFEFYRVK